jgi:hypothetical protein
MLNDTSRSTRSAYARPSVGEITPSSLVSMPLNTNDETATPGVRRSTACTRSFSTEIIVACRYSSSLCPEADAARSGRIAAATLSRLGFISQQASGRSRSWDRGTWCERAAPDRRLTAVARIQSPDAVPESGNTL